MFAELLTHPDRAWPPSGETPDWSALSVAPSPGTPYGRCILHASSAGEVLLLQWASGVPTAPHDHGGASGWVRVLQGHLEEQRYARQGQSLRALGWRGVSLGNVSQIGAQDIHAMRAVGPALSLHVYQPLPPRGMRLFPAQGSAVQVGPGCGAWWPAC